MDDILVTSDHLRMLRARYDQGGRCVPGIQTWFTRYGLDFEEFLRNGLPASAFEATGDERGLELVQIAREGG